MERQTGTARPDWQARVEAIGFEFHTLNGRPYWDEDVAYRFTEAEIDILEDATAELEKLCLQAVDHVVRRGRLAEVGIPEDCHRLVRDSWSRFDRNVIGRFDLSWNGEGLPKLLEYNADTPTSLYEAGVVQWQWLEETGIGPDQFNSIHEKLIEAWGAYGLEGPLHFACVRDHPEDIGTTEYMRDTAMQAGLETRLLYMDEIGWDGLAFLDADDRTVLNLFKLYPWEWLVREDFGRHIEPSRTHMIEPPWKMVLSTKAILPILWELFPDHPNLLAAAREPEMLSGPVVAKPIHGREGEGVVLMDRPRRVDGTVIYQAQAPLPDFGGQYPVIGSWVVASQPAGIGIREDDGPVTVDTSRFIPHYFA